MKNHGRFSYDVYRKRFGSWNEAIIKSGLTPIPSGGNAKPCFLESKSKNKSPRKYVSHKLALSILKRDYFKCVLCGQSPAVDKKVKLHIDHIKPVALGGKTIQWNLWILCSKCNLAKGSKHESDTYWFATTYLAKRILEENPA